ncbi:MAG: lipopolysaccharide assembly protein LapA domain-containing protein [Acidimicrobiia bacterium]
MPDREPRDRAQLARLIVILAVVALVLWFAFANSQRVTVDFVVAERRSRLIFVILGSAVLGAVAGALVRRRRQRD